MNNRDMLEYLLRVQSSLLNSVNRDWELVDRYIGTFVVSLGPPVTPSRHRERKGRQPLARYLGGMQLPPLRCPPGGSSDTTAEARGVFPALPLRRNSDIAPRTAPRNRLDTDARTSMAIPYAIQHIIRHRRQWSVMSENNIFTGLYRLATLQFILDRRQTNIRSGRRNWGEYLNFLGNLFTRLQHRRIDLFFESDYSCFGASTAGVGWRHRYRR